MRIPNSTTSHVEGDISEVKIASLYEILSALPLVKCWFFRLHILHGHAEIQSSRLIVGNGIGRKTHVSVEVRTKPEMGIQSWRITDCRARQGGIRSDGGDGNDREPEKANGDDHPDEQVESHSRSEIVEPLVLRPLFLSSAKLFIILNFKHFFDVPCFCMRESDKIA